MSQANDVHRYVADQLVPELGIKIIDRADRAFIDVGDGAHGVRGLSVYWLAPDGEAIKHMVSDIEVVEIPTSQVCVAAEVLSATGDFSPIHHAFMATIKALRSVALVAPEGRVEQLVLWGTSPLVRRSGDYSWFFGAAVAGNPLEATFPVDGRATS